MLQYEIYLTAALCDSTGYTTSIVKEINANNELTDFQNTIQKLKNGNQ